MDLALINLQLLMYHKNITKLLFILCLYFVQFFYHDEHWVSVKSANTRRKMQIYMDYYFFNP